MHLDLRLRKIIRDLWRNRRQTLLVALAIGLGILGLSGVTRTRSLIENNLTLSYRKSRPPHVIFSTVPFGDEAALRPIREISEVSAVEALVEHRGLRLLFADELSRPLSLIARTNYEDQSLSRLLHPSDEAPTPGEGEILLERSYGDLSDAQPGDSVSILRAGESVPVRFVGTLHSPGEMSSRYARRILAYTTRPALGAMGFNDHFNRIHLRTVDGADAAAIDELVAEVEATLEAQNIRVIGSRIEDVDQHPLAAIVNPAIALFQTLGWLAMLLSLFLVVNSVVAYLARQREQIGVMKALGFRPRQIVTRYLTLVLLLGVLAALIAIPLGHGVALALSRVALGQLNTDLISSQVPPNILGLELLVGLALPLLAAFIPIQRSARIPVRAAIGQSPGLLDRFGLTALDRLLVRIPFLPPSWLYALRNLGRRKARLLFTLLPLTVIGAILIAVLSLRVSLLQSVEEATAYWQEDLRLDFPLDLGGAFVRNEFLAIDGVETVEPRLVRSGLPVESTGRSQITLIGLRPESPFLQPTLLEGTWLQPEELDGLVINADVLRSHPDIRVGDELMVDVAGHGEIRWRVVGLIAGQVVDGAGRYQGAAAYAHYHFLSESVGAGGMANQFLFGLEQEDPRFQEGVARELEGLLTEFGLQMPRAELTSELRLAIENIVGTSQSIVSMMILLFAFVGVLGLVSMMNLNILERGRELGVLRALGQRSGGLRRLVALEGLAAALLGWLLALPLAIPLSRILGEQVGRIFLNAPLPYLFPATAPLLWLGLSGLLALVASLLLVRSATTVPVTDLLTYE